MTSAVIRGLWSIVIIGASAATLAAQHGDAGATFHGGVDLVVMDVIVSDGHRDPVPNLTQSDFNVYEDGAQQPVSFFATRRVPIDTALVFDTSASMAGEIDAVQQCGTGYAESMSDDDRATVIDLKERVNILQPLTSSKTEVAAAMTQLAESGQTALYDGLYVALAEIGRARKHADIRSGVLVVLTDGADTVSTLAFDQMVEQARHQGVAIYVVRMQGKALARELTKREIAAAHHAMDQLAAETGGRVLVEEHDDLGSLCGDIARELADRYTLGYLPANAARDGRYRRITVRVDGRPDLTARTRAGYLMSSGCNCSRSNR